MSDQTNQPEVDRPPECVFSRQEGVWHVARSRNRSDIFMPIRCSQTEGIVMPGNLERRVPTCPHCLRAIHRTAHSDETAP